LTRPRGAVVVTGSELVRGERTDRNGPFLAGELMGLGVEPTRIEIVGDDPAELERALRAGLEHDLCVVSGGLGPTHDDRTVELLARAAARDLLVEPGLYADIERISRGISQRLRRPYADFAEGVRKQATVPDGAVVVGIAGTAPALVLEAAKSVAVVLPGPPGELRRLWPLALATEPVRSVLTRARAPERRLLRFYGVSESTVAQALAEAGGEVDGLIATVCAHDFEIHVDLVAEEGGGAEADDLAGRLRRQLGRYLFAEDGRSVAELVLDACRQEALTLAVAESCTGGLVAARLTAVPGSSDVFLGGFVAYADGVKRAELGVPAHLLAKHGAVSAEVAGAMAAGARARLGAGVSVAVTGIAGPGGGTAEKPVGLVFLHAEGPSGVLAREMQLHGDRDTVRGRATAASLHLLRTLLAQIRHEVA
jgi:nicotinamide-nucleotide amidase